MPYVPFLSSSYASLTWASKLLLGEVISCLTLQLEAVAIVMLSEGGGVQDGVVVELELLTIYKEEAIYCFVEKLH